nr:GlsB/YeaQ/YmgE family stress response membrane protein [Micromonospora sp. DSM 115978]
MDDAAVFQIIWIVFAGLIIGALAHLVLRGKQEIPIWLTIVFGILGAWIGNVIASGLGVRDTSGFDWIRHILQIGVAAGLIVLLSPVYLSWKHRRSGSRTGSYR